MPRRTSPENGTSKGASRNQTTETRSVDSLRRDGISKSALLCRTCLRCRIKKIKCSGVRPRCTSCIASNEGCKYPEDARRSGRMTKADTQALQDEIFILRQIIAGQQQTDHQVSETQLSTVANSHVEEPTCQQLENSSGYWGYTSNANGDSRLNQAHASVDVSEFRPNALQSPVSETQAQRQGSYGPAPADNQSHGRSSDARQEAAEQGPSPQDINIASSITEDGQVKAYGVTSTLHEPAAAIPNATGEGNPTAEDDIEKEKNARDQLVRDQLISNALIQRQRETSLHLAPRIEEKIDLDGVAPDVAFHLLNLHWNRQHYSFLLTYRPAIMDSLINGGQHINKLLLNAIYYSSSLYSDRIDLRSDPTEANTLGGRFYHRFKELLADEIDQPSIPTAVALLLCGASLVSHGKQSAGWVFCGIAYRMIIDLGCHLSMEEMQQHSGGPSKDKPPSRSTVVEFEIRKRVFWGAYMTDKFQSLYLGRAPALRSSEAQLPKELLDCYEELELWEPYRGLEAASVDMGQPAYQPRPAYAVSTFSSLLELAEITSRVIDAFYSKGCMNISKEDIRPTKTDIERQLENWARSLPSHLHFDPDTCPTPPPHQITPHAIYWTLTILLERPFLSTGHLSFISDPADQVIGEEKCATAVFKIWGLVKAYQGTFTLRRAPYLLCYATYSAVLVILCQTQQGRARFSECIPFFWSALLDLQQGCNAGLKKPLSILRTLMRRLGEDIPQFHLAAIERKSRSFPNNTSGGELGMPTAGATSLPNGAPDFDLQGYTGLGESLITAEILESLELGLGNSEHWFNTVVNDEAGLIDDSMYGLFTS